MDGPEYNDQNTQRDRIDDFEYKNRLSSDWSYDGGSHTFSSPARLDIMMMKDPRSVINLLTNKLCNASPALVQLMKPAQHEVHLQSPLLNDKLSMLLKSMSGNKKYSNMPIFIQYQAASWLELIPFSSIGSIYCMIEYTQFSGALYNLIEDIQLEFHNEIKQLFRNLNRMINSECDVLITELYRLSGNSSPDFKANRCLSNSPYDDSMLKHYALTAHLESIRDSEKVKYNAEMTEYPTFRFDKHTSIKIWGSGEFQLLQLQVNNKVRYGTLIEYRTFLCIVDTILSRYQTLFYCRLFYIVHDITLIPIQVLRKIYNWGDLLLKKHQEHSFSMIKLLEALCNARILQMGDDSIYDNFWHSRIDALIDAHTDSCIAKNISSRKCNCHYLEIIMIIRSLKDPIHVTEIHGLFRAWGHPIVSSTVGMIAISEIMKQRKHFNYRTILEVSGVFNKMFTMAYIQKHRRWPSLWMPNDMKRSTLALAYESNNTVFNPRFRGISDVTWSRIRFNRAFTINDNSSSVSYINDKAMSYNLSQLHLMFHDSMIGVERRQRINAYQSHHQRKVILYELKNPPMTTKEMIKIVSLGGLTKEDLVIGLMPKERELKLKPRMFALLTAKLRFYFVDSEDMIKTHIFPYFPGLYAGMSETEHRRSMLRFTDPRNDIGKSYHNLFINADMSKWNTLQSHECNRYVLRSVDDLLGLKNFIYQTHKILSSCVIYNASHFDPPSNLINRINDYIQSGVLVEDDNLHKSLFGGIEGQRQAGWTLPFQAAAYKAAANMRLRVEAKQCGDDMTIRAQIKKMKSKTMKNSSTINYTGMDKCWEQVKNYMNGLGKIIKSMGHKLNQDDSFISRNLVIISKIHFINGVESAEDIKRIQRMTTETNAPVDTIDTIVASQSSACQTACLNGFSALCPQLMARHEHMRYLTSLMLGTTGDLIEEGLKKLNIPWSLDRIKISMFMAYFPAGLGGLPVTSFLALLIRGHGDPVTLSLLDIKILSKGIKWPKEILKMMIHNSWLSPSLEFPNRPYLEDLIVDPYSINSPFSDSTPGTIKGYLRGILSTDYVTNPQLKTLFGCSDPKYYQAFSNWLLSTRPFCPRFCREVYDNSIPGMLTSLMSLIGAASTVKRIKPAAYKTFTMNCSKAQIRRLVSLIVAFKISSNFENRALPDLDSICVRSLADMLRAVGHNVPLHFIKDVTVPHPAEFLQGHVLRTTPGYLDLTDGVMLISLMRTGLATRSKGAGFPLALMERGKGDPFLGARTVEQLNKRDYLIKHNDRILSASTRLLTTANWLASGENYMSNQVLKMVEHQTGLSREILKMFSDEVLGGTPAHRLQDVVTKHEVAPSLRVNIFTHFDVTSDTFSPFAGSNINYDINFGAITLYIMTLSSQIMLLTNLNPEASIFKIACPSCIHEIEERAVNTSLDIPLPELDSLPDILTVKHMGVITEEFCVGDIDLLSKFIEVDADNPAMLGYCISYMIYHDSMGVVLTSFPDDFQSSSVRSYSKVRIQNLIGAGIRNIAYYFCDLLLLYHFGDILRVFSNYGKTKSSLKIKYFGVGTELPGAGEELEIFSQIFRSYFQNKRFTWFSQICSLIPYLSTQEIIQSGLEDFTTSNTSLTGDNKTQGMLFNYTVSLLPTVINDHISQNRPEPIFLSDLNNLAAFPMIAMNLYVIRSLNWLTQPKGTLKALRELYKEMEIYPTKRAVGGLTHTPSMISKKRILHTYDILHKLNFNPENHFAVFSTGAQKYLRRSRVERIVSDVITTMDFKADLVSKPHPIEYLLEVDVSCQIPELVNYENNNDSEEYQRFPRTYSDHFFRTLGTLSTSFYKYHQIFSNELNDQAMQKPVGLCLCEGAGSVASILSMVWGYSIIYNSLINPEEIAAQRIIHTKPQFVQCVKRPVDIETQTTTLQANGDITDIGLQDLLIASALKKADGDVNNIGIITCDAEFIEDTTGSNTLMITMSILRIASRVMNPNLIVVFKTFANHTELLSVICSLFNQLFSIVKVVVVHYSSHESNEVFVIGKMSKIKTRDSEINILALPSHLKERLRFLLLNKEGLSKMPLQLQLGLEHYRRIQNFYSKLIPSNESHSVQSLIGSPCQLKLSDINLFIIIEIDAFKKAKMAYLNEDMCSLNTMEKTIRSHTIGTKQDNSILYERRILNALIIREAIIKAEKKSLYNNWRNLYRDFDPSKLKIFKSNSAYSIGIKNTPYLNYATWIRRYGKLYWRVVGHLIDNSIVENMI